MPLEPSVMLFAAGYGTRMAPLTNTLPKPLIEVAGKPLIGHAVDLARAARVGRIVANTHYLAEKLRPWLQEEGIIEVHETDLLETGGGLRNAMPHLGTKPVITLNTDAVWHGANPVEALLNAWRPDEMEALLLLVPAQRAVCHAGEGDFALTTEGRLQRGGGFVYSGLQILKTDRLGDIEGARFSLNVVWDRMSTAGGLYGLVYDGRWCDVGRPENIAAAEAMLADV